MAGPTCMVSCLHVCMVMHFPWLHGSCLPDLLWVSYVPPWYVVSPMPYLGLLCSYICIDGLLCLPGLLHIIYSYIATCMHGFLWLLWLWLSSWSFVSPWHVLCLVLVLCLPIYGLLCLPGLLHVHIRNIICLHGLLCVLGIPCLPGLLVFYVSLLQVALVSYVLISCLVSHVCL